jgi:hypothetical protein
VKDDRQLTLTDGKKDEQNKNISALKKIWLHIKLLGYSIYISVILSLQI